MLTLAAMLHLLFQIQPAPVERVWIRSRVAGASVQPIAPDVQEIGIEANFVRIRSAGPSFQSFGPLQAAPLNPNGGARRFEFRIPRIPTPQPTQAPPAVTGVFINGVPIYNPAGPLSYQDQDIWHVDAVALSDDGTLTVTGRPAAVPHPVATPPLLQALLDRNTEHSPLIGFALDGYPVYGPYGEGGQRHRSSYRLRKISNRRTLPDGTELPPSQEGPPISSDFPLGTFAEDYECVAGAGDLDCHNGRFAVTPDFPQGTYAYFAATETNGKLAFPYLIGRSYAGEFSPELPAVTKAGSQSGLTLSTSTAKPRAGQPVTWVFQTAVTGLEKVHERPVHLIVVSRDQTLFDHVHPEWVTPNSLRLDYTFAQGGRYWLYADFTPVGGVQTIARFAVDVEGASQPASAATSIAPSLTISEPLEAGRDLSFRFDFSKFPGLDRYLGAWGHIILMSADGEDFIHAHPKENLPVTPTNPWIHVHDTASVSPAEIETVTGFRRPGQYKIWLQIQKNGQVLTFPYSIRVSESHSSPVSQTVPPDAIRIEVDEKGFTPSRVSIPVGAAAKLVFHRANSQNCAGRVVFPALKIDRELPPNSNTVVEIPAQAAGDFTFGCGMGMFRGALVVVQKP